MDDIPTARNMIVELTPQYLEDWANLYNRFYRPFTWILPTNAKESSALLEEGAASCSYMVIQDRKVVAIATLDMRGGSTTATLRYFAFRRGHRNDARFMLDGISTAAKERGFECMDVWVYDSISAVLRLLNETEFKEKGRESLMLMELDESFMSPDSSPLVFRSLADGLSIGSFVGANRAAFEADGSRLLETAELEKWVADFDGFVPDIQLAAQSGNAIVGTVMSEVTEVQRGKSLVKLAWVYGLGVLPTARHQGVGTALMNELLKRLQLRGVSEVWLVTDAEGGVRTFYEEVGFEHYAYVIKYSRLLR